MGQKLEVYRGASDAKRVAIVTKGNNNLYQMKAGEKIVFGVKQKPEDEELLIRKIITSIVDGVATINFTPKDTIGLKYGRYVYDMGLASGEDYYPIIKSSAFVIMPNVTRLEDST
jgi:hypothetical protein